MIAYNQEQYIRQAVESVLMQKTVFEYELIIGEDCSIDGTRSILKDCQAQNPERIRLLPNEQNMGATRNLARTLEEGKGEYVALLEGDDYWTSPFKLQKQADFLDSHPDYAIVYHATQLVNRAGKPKFILPFPQFKKPTSTLLDLIVNDSFMATCSIMFRNHLFENFPPVFFTSNLIADWPLNVLNAQHGLIGYLDEMMSIYRSNSSEGAFTAKRPTVIMCEAIKINEAFNAYFDFQYDRIFRTKLARYYYAMAMDYLRFGDLDNAIRSMRQSIQKELRADLLFRAFFGDGPSNYIIGVLRNYAPRLSSKIKWVFYKQ
jgi:glycosyltransferase involved in cell wall biosynthesis